MVTVYGPQEALDKIEFIEADIQLNDLKNSGKLSVPLTIVAPIIEISPAKIDINIVGVIVDDENVGKVADHVKRFGGWT